MTKEPFVNPDDRVLTTPHSAAVAGILSGLLFLTSHLLLAYAVSLPREVGEVSGERTRLIMLSLYMVPYAGLFFLWFIGVARDRLGRREDQFFATVFLGSGLLYLAMIFTAAAIGVGFLEISQSVELTNADSIRTFSMSITSQIVQTFGIRMAAVFMISSATMWTRTRVMPRWLAILTFLLGLALLVLINVSLWVTLIFPVWILGVSILILIFNYRQTVGTNAAAA